MLACVGTLHAQDGLPWTLPLNECWSLSFPDASYTAIASDNASTIFLAKNSPTIQALSVNTGELQWTVEFGGKLISDLKFVEGRLRFVAEIEGEESSNRQFRVYEIDPQTGISLTKGQRTLLTGGHMEFDGKRFFFLGPDGTLSAFGIDGSRIWEISLQGAKFRGLKIFGNELAAFDSEGLVQIISMTGGVQVGGFKMISEASGAFARSGKRFYAGASDGWVYAFNSDNSEIEWRSRTGGSIYELAVLQEDLLVSSNDNFIYRLAAGSGRRMWKRKLAGRIVGSAMLIDSLYSAYVSYGNNEVYIVRLTDGKVINKYAASTASYFPSGPLVLDKIIILPLDAGITALSPTVCKK